jgi:hypothetical protein
MHLQIRRLFINSKGSKKNDCPVNVKNDAHSAFVQWTDEEERNTDRRYQYFTEACCLIENTEK